MLPITLRQIEYATATDRCGGVTAAAAALNVSQPALSVALAQLETALGQPLFLRRPGGRITPTSFGRGWLAEAQAQLDALTRLMSGETPAAPVRLACFEDLAPTHLAPLLRKLAEAAPEIIIAPEILPFETIAEGLRTGRIDLALTWDLGLDSSTDRRALQQIAPHAVVAADHPLAAFARKGTTLASLADHPLILADQGPSLAHMRALFSARGLPFTIAHRTATIDLMRSFAANGFGVGLSYTRPSGRRSHDGARLATVPITDAGTEPIILARTAGNPLAPPAEQIAALIPTLFTPSQDADGDS
jgi:DNA-binding transcriptional LysR family regulator